MANATAGVVQKLVDECVVGEVLVRPRPPHSGEGVVCVAACIVEAYLVWFFFSCRSLVRLFTCLLVVRSLCGELSSVAWRRNATAAGVKRVAQSESE